METTKSVRPMTYRRILYNEIGTLEDAAKVVDATSTHGLQTHKQVRQLLVDHNKNDAFGISLLHRHFPLGPKQILVEMNNITTPWSMFTMGIAQLYAKGYTQFQEGIIYPTSWMIVAPEDGQTGGCGLMPYEFAFTFDWEFVPDNLNPFSRENEAFVASFLDTVRQLGYEKHVALSLVPEVDVDGAIETTIGHANVLRLKGEHNVVSPAHPADSKHNIQASFFWPTQPDGTISQKAKGASCEGWDTCKATVKGRWFANQSSEYLNGVDPTGVGCGD